MDKKYNNLSNSLINMLKEWRANGSRSVSFKGLGKDNAVYVLVDGKKSIASISSVDDSIVILGVKALDGTPFSMEELKTPDLRSAEKDIELALGVRHRKGIGENYKDEVAGMGKFADMSTRDGDAVIISGDEDEDYKTSDEILRIQELAGNKPAK